MKTQEDVKTIEDTGIDKIEEKQDFSGGKCIGFLFDLDPEDAEEQFDLGLDFFFGEGLEQSYEEAIKWFRKAAEQGHALLCHSLYAAYQRLEL